MMRFPVKRPWGTTLISLVGLSLLLPLGIGVTLGRSHAEKTLTHMATPFSMLWALLFGIAIYLAVTARVKHFVYVLIGMTILWVSSAPFFSKMAMRRIEQSVTSWDYKKDPPFDAIVVFGGGSSRDGWGRSQLTGSGDRVAWAARLFHMGKTPLLIATGDPFPGSNAATEDPSQQTREIWIELNVPQEAIDEIAGTNTWQEIQSLKKWTESKPVKRVGLLSSAFHLPRVMRLAKRAGIEGVPIGSDYRASNASMEWDDLLPSAGGLNQTELILKEWLAAILGR